MITALDLATLRVMFALIGFLLFVLVMSVQHGRPRSSYGTWWALAMLSYFVSGTTYLLEDAGHPVVALAGGRFLLVMGTQCFWASVHSISHAVRPLRLLPLPLLVLVTTAVGDPSAGRWAGGAVFFAAMTIALGGTAYTLRRLSPSYRRLQAPMAYGMGVAAVFFLLRFVVLVSQGSGSATFQSFFGAAPSTVVLILLVVLSTFSMTIQSAELDANHLRARATHDELTGLLNRQGFLELAGPELDMLSRHGLPAAMVLIDLDHFKAVNDTYGHPAGDAVLATFAHTAQNRIRASDHLGRYGGEEFILLLSGVTAVEAQAITREISEVFAGVRTADGVPLPTASFGIAASDPKRSDLAGLIEAADEALYRAKKNGRNQSAVA